MAALVDHVAQAKHNIDCARQLVQGAIYRDWAITATFYSALHYAEAGFTATDVGHADVTCPKDSDTHWYRQQMVREYFGNACYRAYRKLRVASQNVRYLSLWSTKTGTALGYYDERAAKAFVDDADTIRQEIEGQTRLDLR